MKIITRTLLMMCLALPAAAPAQEQPWNLKTNLLYDAATTLNLGTEFRIDRKTSLDIPLSYNPFIFSQGQQWRHFLVQPEVRFWKNESFGGHFLGVHGHYASYNAGNLPKPFAAYMQTHRFEGWLAGVGVSYGYRWNFRDPRWALEATVGMGYAYLNYNRFECEKCGLVLGPGKKNYFGPTKAGLILILNLGGKPKSDDSFVGVYVPQSHEVATPQPAPKSEARPEAKPLVQAAPESVPAVPTVRREKMHSASGEAYLDFFAGRSEIVSNFRDNAAELQKIDSLIGSILADPSAEITAIIITGHASPEGNPAENLALSKQRADALRNRIGSVHGLPNRLFSVYSTGDDWDRLDTLIEGSDLPQKERLLEILRSDDAGDIRERKLRMINGGASYGLLLDRIYPKLRRTDYRIYYSVREE